MVTTLPSYIIGGVIALLLICLITYAQKKSSRVINRSKKLAPELPGAWPLFGHFRMLATSNLPHLTLGALADKHGPIFTIWIGLHPALVVSDWEVAKDIFTANDKAVTARPKLAAAKFSTYNYAIFAFTPTGPYWRDIRKFSSSELLASRCLEQHKDVKLQEVGNQVRELYKKWKEKRVEFEHSGKLLVALDQWFGDLNMNVFLRLVAGKKFSGEGIVGDTVEKGRKCQKVIKELFHYWGILLLRDAVPFLGWLDVGGHEKKIKRVFKDMDEFAEEWLAEHKRKQQEHDVASELEGERDFMDITISFLKGKSVGGYDADTINKATSLSMITGGQGTTTVVMTWALTLLLNNRNVLRKAQEELDTHVGKERMVNDTDINNLVYLQAIVKEVLRLYPPAPIPGPRQFLEDSTVGGYFVPKGTWLIVNIKKIQTDPRMWPDPLEFRPERFLTTHRNVDVRGQSFELIPFGSGRRACPAISFALQMLHLTLASLLHCFDISTPGNEPVDMSHTSGLNTVKATPLEVLLSPRLSPQCFQ